MVCTDLICELQEMWDCVLGEIDFRYPLANTGVIKILKRE